MHLDWEMSNRLCGRLQDSTCGIFLPFISTIADFLYAVQLSIVTHPSYKIGGFSLMVVYVPPPFVSNSPLAAPVYPGR